MKTLFLFLLTGLAVIGLTRSPLAAPMEIISTGTRTSITGAGHSFLPAISGDGRVVLFFSQANNLVTNDNRLPHLDLFVRDLSNGVTRLVSVNSTGTGGAAGDSGFASISSNGQSVVFASAANDLVQDDANLRSDVFFYDAVSGGLRLVSINAAGTRSANAGAGVPAMSRDGRWVAFESQATDLGPPKQSFYPFPIDIFVRDMWSNVTVMASVNTVGDGGGSASSVSPVITPDGRFVAFVSQATNLVAGVTPYLGEIYVRDLQANTTTWASAGVSPFLQASNTYKADQPLISDDGKGVVFTAGSRLFHFNLQSSMITVLADWPSTTNTPDFRASLSANGRFVAYQDGTNVWVADIDRATNTLVSVGTNGIAPADGVSFAPSLSADGQRVIFFSSSSGLVTNLVDGRQQIYVRDVAAGTTRLVSANVAGMGANGDQFPGTVAWSDDGMVIAFDSPADDLVNDDLNQASDVFVRHLDTATTECVTRRIVTSSSLFSAADSALVLDGVSSNASVVLFRSQDNNFMAGDTNGWADLFARNAASNSITLVTPLSDGVAGTNHPLTPYAALSANGRYAAWTSAGSSPFQIFRKDLVTGTVDLVVTNATPFSDTFQRTNLFAISPDGTRIAYERTNQMYLHDLVADTEARLSQAVSGWVYFHPQFSPDGRWLAYLGKNTSGDTVAIFAYDFISASNRLVATNSSILSGISPGVKNLSFNSSSSNLVFDAYVWPFTLGVFTHLLGGQPTNQSVCYPCERPSSSGDGRHVVYSRWNDANNPSYFELVLKDRQTGIEELVTPVKWGYKQVTALAISPDARFIVFSGLSGAVVPNDTNNVSDVFVRDRLLKITTCLSVSQLGVPANGSSGNPVLSVDGRTVVFQSTASDLAVADYNDKRDVFAVRIGHDDTDGDGLDDDWEMAFFENLAHDGTADSDSDGSSDRAEFFAGTDPTNQGSVLRATTLVPQGGGTTTILWDAVPGRTYQVQFKDNVGDANWSLLPGTVTAATTTGVMIDTTASGTPQRFYRVMLAP